MKPFGSVYENFDEIEFTTADEKYIKIKNNFLTKIGFKVLGLPHVGLRLRARKILDNIPKNVENMLDAGCGTGVYSFTLRKRAGRIRGIDIDQNKINYVRRTNRYNNIDFLKGDLRKINFDKESFDLVICSDVIEHIKEDKKAFREISRVLKNGGIIRFTVPYKSKSNSKDYKKYGHERPGYNEEDIKKMAKENNLIILNIEYYSYPLTEIFSKINYKIVDNKILLGLLFYPLYFLSIMSDKLGFGEPNGLSVVFKKNN